MVQKMIENDLLEPLDYDKIPNISNIDPDYLKSAEQFDPGNRILRPLLLGYRGYPLQQDHGRRTRGQLGYPLG